MADKTLQTTEVSFYKATPQLRREMVARLSEEEKTAFLDNLVEAAMLKGLTEAWAIRRYVGLENIPVRNFMQIRERIMTRWVSETSDVYKHAHEQRAIQLNKAWEIIRDIEDLYPQAKTIDTKIKLRKLVLEWMQYISKLSFVEKLVEASEPDLQIIVNTGQEKVKPKLQNIYDGDD